MADGMMPPLENGQEKVKREALRELFAIEPKTSDLTKAQMTRRAIFPRWEIIRPSEFDPVQEENRILEEIIEAADLELPSPPKKKPVH
jgi:hypothetical protein